jgi:hypothetical protein
VALGEWDKESDETAWETFGLDGTAVALLIRANSPLHRWPSDFLESQKSDSRSMGLKMPMIVVKTNLVEGD